MRVYEELSKAVFPSLKRATSDKVDVLPSMFPNA